MKQIFIFSLILLGLAPASLGQSWKIKHLNQMAASFFRDSSHNGAASARFCIDIQSSGNYSVKDKLFYIIYPETNDTSKVCHQASYIEKTLSLQGGKRTYHKDSAAILINVFFERERKERSIYLEMKYPTYSTANMGSFNVFRGDHYASASSTSSRNNPNLPYYSDSFGSAGKKKYLQKVPASMHSFSLIIDGISQAGEHLWRTVATDYRSTAVTDAIMPYLCFAAIGHIGKETDCSVQFLSDNPMFLNWASAVIDSKNCILYPDYSSSSKKVEVTAVICYDEKIIIALKDCVNPEIFQQSEAFLEYDKHKVKLSQKFIEERLQNKNYPALTLWEFPIQSNNIDDFDIVFYNKKGKEKLSIRNIKISKDD